MQAFLGFCNFYRRFIRGYSSLAQPLTALTRDDATMKYPWHDGSSEDLAFIALKKAYTSAEMLMHFNPDKETWLETDASDYVIAAVLSQKDSEGVLRPVAFLSHKMTPAECNYEIYDKELLAIVRAFEEWRPELSSVETPIAVFSDHKNLEWFMTTKTLNRRQARWAEFLSEFNFKITYRPGKQGTKPDSLTRRPGDIPEGVDDPRLQHQNQIVLKDHMIERISDNNPREAVLMALELTGHVELTPSETLAWLYALSEETTDDTELDQHDSLDHGVHTQGEPEGPNETELDQHDSLDRIEDREEDAPSPLSPDEIVAQIWDCTDKDSDVVSILKAIANGARRAPPELYRKGVRIELQDCKVIEEAERRALTMNGRWYVPDVDNLRTKVIQSLHEPPTTGHAGRTATYARVARHYFWPNMSSDVAEYVKACQTCRRSKSRKEGKHGLLRPLPLPRAFWSDISVDFITPLPTCQRHGRNFCHIMTVVDRLSKTEKYIALDSLEVEDVVTAFVEYVWRQEGYPDSVVSDRGSQFVSHFWRRLCERLGTTPKLSTSFHPETDGQSERANARLKQYLRAYVNYAQDDWVDLLPIAEFVANSSASESTGFAPFVATKGYLPKAGVEPPRPLPADATRSQKIEAAEVDKMMQRQEDTVKVLKENLLWAQQRMKLQSDKSRHPAPWIRVGDEVMLDARNLKTDRPNKSLDFKMLGPFKVAEIHNDYAVRLDLPASFDIFPVFHPWLLHPVAGGLPGQNQDPPPPIEVYEGEGRYEVKEVVDSRVDKRRKDVFEKDGKQYAKKGYLQYKLQYVNWDAYNTKPWWQDYEQLDGCREALADYHRRYPEKDGPHETFVWPDAS